MKLESRNRRWMAYKSSTPPSPSSIRHKPVGCFKALLQAATILWTDDGRGGATRERGRRVERAREAGAFFITYMRKAEHPGFEEGLEHCEIDTGV